jgi:hypothetical protein
MFRTKEHGFGMVEASGNKLAISIVDPGGKVLYRRELSR